MVGRIGGASSSIDESADGDQPHTLGFLRHFLNVSTAGTQPTFDRLLKILMTPLRCGYANSWGVSGPHGSVSRGLWMLIIVLAVL
jgi:hypothetical protein